MTLRVVCYLNQFYAGIGGEEKADAAPGVSEKPLGPAARIATLLAAETAGEAQVVGTVWCGDGTYGERTEEAREGCLALAEGLKPDVLIAGPAWNAGRYGFACGDLCDAAAKRGIRVLTAMAPANPAVALYAKTVRMVETGERARGEKDFVALTRVAGKILRGEVLGPAAEEGTIPMGIRRNVINEKSGAERAVEMLLNRLAGRPWRTEYEMPRFDRVPPAAPLADLSRATIALVSSGGLVPRGNPDRIRVSSAESFGRYDLTGVDDLTPEKWESIHGGYDRVWAAVDPDVIAPVDMLRELEREGLIGRLHPIFYTTTGTGTSVAFAESFGRAIGEELRAAGVDAAILTST
jgi:glycine reductase